jgi:hypothetical protein
VKRWRSLEGGLAKIFSLPRIDSDAKRLGRSSGTFWRVRASLSSTSSTSTGDAALSTPGKKKKGVFFLRTIFKDTESVSGLGWAGAGLRCWAALVLAWAAAACFGGQVKFSLSFSFLNFFVLFSGLHLLFDFKFELYLILQVLNYLNLNRT